MPWTILSDPDFAEWFASESQPVRKAITDKVAQLAVEGPNLGRPAVDTLEGSAIAHLKELRVQVKGQPYRVFFIFDPKRQGILLVGGNKRGDARFYVVNIPIAEARYARHLEQLRLQDESDASGEG